MGCMLYGEGVFDTIPIEADYTVGDMKLWLKAHKDKDPAEYDIVGPKGRWKMGSGSEVLQDDQVIAEFMGERFEHKWLMQLSLFPKKKNEETGSMESTFETVDEWVPPPPEDAFTDEEDNEQYTGPKRRSQRRSQRRTQRRSPRRTQQRRAQRKVDGGTAMPACLVTRSWRLGRLFRTV